MLNDLADDHKLRFYFLSDFRKSRRDDVPGIIEELKSAEANGDRTTIRHGGPLGGWTNFAADAGRDRG